MFPGEAIRGGRVVDGDASTLTAITLYPAGSLTARALASSEFLNITSLHIMVETAGDVLLQATADLAIVDAGLPETGGLTHQFDPPFVCPKGLVPKFSWPASNKSSCIITGYITKV